MSEQTQEVVSFDAIKATADSALLAAQSVTVTDLSTAEVSKSKAVELQRVEKRIEEIRKELVKPLNDQVSAINATAKSLSSPIGAAKSELANKLMRWQNEERMKAEAKAEEERKQREAEAAAIAASDDATFEEIEEAEAKVELAAAPVKMTKSETPLQVREIWKFSITDKAALPEDLKLPNEAEIGRRVRAGARVIPGVEIFSEQVAVVR